MAQSSKRSAAPSTSAECKPGLVSVIMPTFNRARMVVDAMESVFEQTYRPIEVIVVDDGSTDDTAEQVDRWCQKSYTDADFLVRYVRQLRQGAPAARNRGVRESRGEFIQFLDSDDLIAPKKLELQVRQLRERGASRPSVAYGPWRCVYEVGDKLRRGPPAQLRPAGSEDHILRRYLSGRSCCSPNTYLFSRSVVVAAGPWDESLQRGQDADFLVRVLLTNPMFVYVPGSWAFYRRHCGDHIGAERHFDEGARSNVACVLSWAELLSAQGKAGAYNQELLHKLQALKRDALVRGRHAVAAACDEAAAQVEPDECARRRWYRRPGAAGIVLKRQLKPPLYFILGEWRLTWVKWLVARLRIAFGL